MPNPLVKVFKRAVTLFDNPKNSLKSVIEGLPGNQGEAFIDESVVLTITPAARAIYILKDVIATTPLHLYERTSDGDIVHRHDHPLDKLLSYRPHPLYTAYNWRSAMMVNTLLSGNGIGVITWNNSLVPAHIQVIPYDQVTDVMMGEDGMSLVYHFKGRKPVKSDDVIHFMMMSWNGCAALNTTETHRRTLQTEISLRDYVKSFMEKGAHIKGFISVPQMLSPDTRKAMKDSWRDQHGGSMKAGGTPLLEGGATYQKMQASIVESGFEQVKASSIADISRIYGVPEYMLDVRNKPTYSSIEHIGMDFQRYTLDGWFTQIEEELTRKLVGKNSEGKLFFKFDRTRLTSGDLKTMGEYYTRLFNIGVLNRDEIRVAINRNRVEGGDRYFIQGNNMMPTDAIDELIRMRGTGPAAVPNNDKPKEDDPGEEIL